jgi:ERCC4-type nuclease
MGVELWIDTREHAFLNAWGPITDTVKVVPLEVGDFQVVWPEEGIHYVFERKTFADLAASIKDGRYREQKARLLAGFRPEVITYILEEVNTQRMFHKVPRGTVFGLANTVYQSFLIHARYRDGFHLFHSSGIEETVEYIRVFIQKVMAHPEYFKRRSGGAAGAAEGGEASGATAAATDYLQHCAIKTCKKDNLTPTLAFQLQLGQIPGISSKMAKVISQHVESMRHLIETLAAKATITEAIQWLQTIPMIGLKKAEAIYTYLGFERKEKE